MVRLRAHHLLCLLTYVGKGYSEAFVRRADALAARLSAGEPTPSRRACPPASRH